MWLLASYLHITGIIAAHMVVDESLKERNIILTTKTEKIGRTIIVVCWPIFMPLCYAWACYGAIRDK